MTDIEKLEAAVGSKVEQWNVSDLEKFSLDENIELLQLFKKPEVIAECVKRAKGNEEVEDVLMPLSIKTLLFIAQNEINDLLGKLERKEIDTDEAIFKCQEIFNNKDLTFYRRLCACLALLNAFEDCDLKDKEIEIKEDIACAKEIVTVLVNKDYFSCKTLIYDILDIIMAIRRSYNQRYEVDVLDDEDGSFKATLDLIYSLELVAAKSLQDTLNENKENNKEEGESNE